MLLLKLRGRAGTYWVRGKGRNTYLLGPLENLGRPWYQAGKPILNKEPCVPSLHWAPQIT